MWFSLCVEAWFRIPLSRTVFTIRIFHVLDLYRLQFTLNKTKELTCPVVFKNTFQCSVRTFINTITFNANTMINDIVVIVLGITSNDRIHHVLLLFTHVYQKLSMKVNRINLVFRIK